MRKRQYLVAAIISFVAGLFATVMMAVANRTAFACPVAGVWASVSLLCYFLSGMTIAHYFTGWLAPNSATT